MLQDYGWDDGGGDNISDLLAIRRVDSNDIVYENKRKTTKVCYTILLLVSAFLFSIGIDQDQD